MADSTYRVFHIFDGRMWDAEAASFVVKAPEGATIIPLYSDGAPAGVDYLKQTLKDYGLKIGAELLTLEEMKITKLQEINASCDAALAALTAT